MAARGLGSKILRVARRRGDLSQCSTDGAYCATDIPQPIGPQFCFHGTAPDGHVDVWCTPL